MEYPELTPKAIKDFREAGELSQRDLAQILGVGIATIKRWERGNITPSGTAAAILNTVIAASLGKPIQTDAGTIPAGAAVAKAVYELLRNVFDREQNTTD